MTNGRWGCVQEPIFEKTYSHKEKTYFRFNKASKELTALGVLNASITDIPEIPCLHQKLDFTLTSEEGRFGRSRLNAGTAVVSTLSMQRISPV